MSSHLGSRPIFIGRDNELAQLRAAFEYARSGRGRLVLLSGPPGIGKSRLAAEFIEDATRSGARVLLGRSWEAGGAPAYWPWVQAIRAYRRTADPAVLQRQIASAEAEMMAILPELGEQTPPVTPSTDGDPASDRFRLFDAIATFLSNVADTEPLVIVLEDLQAADVPTLLLLEFVTSQVAEAALLIVATYRDIELTSEHPLTSTLAELHRSPVTTHLALDGLNADEVARFLEAMAGSEAATTLSAALHHKTSGNPLFLGEAVRLITSNTLAAAPLSMARVTIPAEIRTVIERRLEVLSPECRSLLETISVLGNEFDVEVASKLADVSVDALLASIGEALTAGLVLDTRGGPGTFGFVHDLVRQSLYARLTPSVRIQLHRRSATVLEEAYEEDEDEHLAEVAFHYFEAAAGGGNDKAVEYGRRAGEQAFRRLAYEEAVRLFEMAVQVLDSSERPDRASLGSLLLTLGEARVGAGDLQEAGKAFRRAADVARRVGDARLLARAAIAYGGRFIFARAGNDTAMVPLLQDALIMLGGQDDRLRVRLLSRLACATRSSADRDHSAALARQGLELARKLDDPPTLAYALTGLVGAIWWPENPEERLELGLELLEVGMAAEGVEGEIDGHIVTLAAYAELGDFAAARRELGLMNRVGGSLPMASQRWLEKALTGLFALSDGVFEEAERRIEETIRQPPVTPARDNTSAGLFQLFLLRREQGRLHEIETSMREAAGDFPWYPIHRLALAILFAVTGRMPDAESILDELAADHFAAIHRDNYWLASMCLVSELAVALGRAELARTLIEELEPFAHLNAMGFPEGSLGSVARYLGLLAGLVGDYDSALSWFEDTLRREGRNGALPWVAHAHYDLARILIERGNGGDQAEAESHLRLALDLCDRVGLVALRVAVQTVVHSSAPEVEPESPPATAVFRREGEYFSVVFDDDAFKIKDSKGLRYLGILLSSPGREIHVLDLVAAESGVEPSLRSVVKHIDEPHIGEDSSPVLDRAARMAYRRRIADLQDEIAEAERFGDFERAETAKHEHDFLVTELASALGLGGRDRMAASAAERARVNVTRAIRAAVTRIDSHSPVLGQHLDLTIRTGAFCSYIPDPRYPFRWDH